MRLGEAMEVRQIQIGPYVGCLSRAHDAPEVVRWLGSIAENMRGPAATVLSQGRNRVVQMDMPVPGGQTSVVVKSFGRQWLWRDIAARQRGSKARRTFDAAVALARAGIGTPEPIACLERWEGRRLIQSCFVSIALAGVSNFGDELNDLFVKDPECRKIMSLLEAVSKAVRRMHDSGFRHNDLGNQNILLRRTGDGQWGDVAFIDLNRARFGREQTLDERARDLSRIWLPSDLRRVFLEMYWAPAPVPPAFRAAEERCRARYSLHDRTRMLRHPLRERRIVKEGGGREYPHEKDLWIWDERSAQAIGALRSRERRRHIPLSVYARQVAAVVSMGSDVRREYRRLMDGAFGTPVAMADRVGVALDPRIETWDRERSLWVELGMPPALVRFYAHENAVRMSFRADAVRELHGAGAKVTAALIQDRSSVRDPSRWQSFVEQVLSATDGVVEEYELGHAINRVKWGIWDFGEYRRFVGASAAAIEGHPSARLVGPAGIDFEYPFVMAALRSVPGGMRFAGLSHHLYVDRRGAPENAQAGFSTVEKCAMARAMARASGVCGDRLVISEVNWPLLGAGVYSPVGSPYESPGPRYNDPSVDEDTYADYTIRYLLLALTSGMADRVFWWRLVARGFGLVDDSDPAAWRRRKAFHAMRQFLAVAGHATFERRIALDRDSAAYVFCDADGRRTAIAYTTGAEHGVELPFAAESAQDIAGQPVAVSGATLTLSGSPRYMTLA
jgi:tRNA A-37 threonylcarbamoyl transferase component Bud32